MINVRTVLIGGLAVLMFAIRPASAGSFGVSYDYYVDESNGACGQPSESVFNSGNLQPSAPVGAGPVTLSDACIYTGQSTGSYSTATVSAFYGSLSASGSGSGTPGVGSNAQAQSSEYTAGGPNVSFTDDLTITSSTLAEGTPVTLTFGLGFTGSDSFTDVDNCCENSDAFVSGEFQVNPLLSTTSSADIDFSAGTSDQTLQITTSVGSTFEIDGYVYGYGTADSPSGDGISSSFNYSGSLSADISGITSGACVTTASGTDYGQDEVCGNASAAPEASTLILFAIAAPVLFLVRRRSR